MDVGEAVVARGSGAGAGRLWAAGLLLGAALWLGGVGGAAAEMEWCDTGSPPPNDFRLQQTASNSAVSPPSWLQSTENGGALQAAYTATGQIDVGQVTTLEGGVATGMGTAVTSTTTAPAPPERAP